MRIPTPHPRPPAFRPALRPAPRPGFTLVELIVVISIIALLAGIVAVGMWGALGSTRDRSTETRFETLSTMLANHAQADQAAGGTSTRKLPSALRAIPGNGNPTYSTTDPIAAPATADPDTIAEEPAFATTQAVLRRLLTAPGNSELFSSLPDDVKTLNVPDGSLLNYAGGGGPGPLDPPLIIDGHGGVILFVPEEGMTGLNFSDGTTDATVLSADGGSFWASAGEDGSFVEADDNVYSTQTRIERVTTP